MKNFFTIILLFSTCLISAQELMGKVTYLATFDDYEEDMLNIDEISVFPKKMNSDEKISNSPIYFHLFFNKSKALFQAEYDLPTKRKLGFKFNKTGLMTSHENKYYIDLKEEDNYYQSFWSQDILVDLEDVNWTLTDETKKIGNFICYKAIAPKSAGQIYQMEFTKPLIAWYTKEIPVSFGIQYFHGLPGLTMELVAEYASGKISYEVTNIDLNKKAVKIEKPEGKRRLTKKEYFEYCSEINKRR
jgi:GLPGLI family protein